MDDLGWDSRLYRARSWIQRAASQRVRDPPDFDGRFIFYWIGFNAMYGQAEYLAEPRQREEVRVRDFVGKMIRLDHETRHIRRVLRQVKDEITTLLKNQFLWREYWTDGFTDGLSTSIRYAEGDVEAALVGGGPIGLLTRRVLERLYELRIQLVHGCSKDGSTANRDSVEPAVTVLKRLVPLFWATMKRCGRSEDWGDLPYPAYGRRGHPSDRRTPRVNAR